MALAILFRHHHLNLGQSELSPRMASMDLQSISWTMREWELSTFQTLSHIRQLTLLASSAGIESWKLMRNLLMICLLSRSNKKLKLGKGLPLALLSYNMIHSLWTIDYGPVTYLLFYPATVMSVFLWTSDYLRKYVHLIRSCLIIIALLNKWSNFIFIFYNLQEYNYLTY